MKLGPCCLRKEAELHRSGWQWPQGGIAHERNILLPSQRGALWFGGLEDVNTDLLQLWLTEPSCLHLQELGPRQLRL